MKLKISRLFHWLYATLMFLPLLMFIPSCLYYGFNEHATNETTTQINYKYQSNEVNTVDDLVEGNIYQFNTAYKSIDDMNITSYVRLQILTDLEFDLEYVTFDDYAFDKLILPLGTYLEIQDDSYFYVYQDYDFQYQIFDFSYVDEFVNNCYVIYIDGECDYTMFSYTDYNVIESVETNVQDTISNKMYQAWEGVWNLPLFQWTKNSFITAPFSYITGLFGLGSDNSLNCVFTYFASISICWLVFDLIMYVPNLAHRWLDRSAIE